MGITITLQRLLQSIKHALTVVVKIHYSWQHFQSFIWTKL